ncbi:MAG: hypothetical protein V1772_04400, partial [Chloroflexota bacterium]
MRPSARQLILLLAALAVALAGCLPTVVRTEHGYVLVRAQGAEALVLEDDDPLYARFEATVRGDPYLAQLLDLFNDATEAFLATNRMTSLTQTLANKPAILLGAPQPGAFEGVGARYHDQTVRLELAIGLPWPAEGALDAARHDLPLAMGAALVRLMGLAPAGAALVVDDAHPARVAAPAAAMVEGFALAL